MKKVIFLIIVVLFCATITGYSQSKHIKLFEEKANSILKMPINNKSSEAYNNLQREAKMKRYTYSDGRQKKKNDAIMNTIERRIFDSISIYEKRKEEFRLEQNRIASIRRDSIKLANETAEQQKQDSIIKSREIAAQKSQLFRDSVYQLNVSVEDFSVIQSKGNGTFNISPNTLARIFSKNATVESIVATFPKYSAYYADAKPNSRRERRYDVYRTDVKYVWGITLEYNPKTRKVISIVIDDPYTDKFKQRLLNAGYRWDSGSSMTATSFGHGYRSYWKKKGSPIFFSINDRIIKIFRFD
ncbi:hypothetical protein [Dysgonomonas sp. 511]|uniref:hypothetical protein n=1 Tax=Dysgonomonas sp. 511 TaxID=2302930 RepID=UPI0013D7EC08|nr:hypothetical protein [Dysgonomonas sp. 511]